MTKKLVCIPFLSGSKAVPLQKQDGDNTHSWSVYVSFPKYIKADLLVKKVSFKLHESFKEPLRVIDSLPFKIDERGWGEFQIQIRIHFMSNSIRPLFLTHQLKLYPDDPSGSSEVVSERWDKICIPAEALAELEEFRTGTNIHDIEGPEEEEEHSNLINTYNSLKARLIEK